MESAATPPLTPPDCDLTGFPFMPVDVSRLMTSDTWVLANGEERAAALCLWMSGWQQIPAGSLPNDERILAHKSMSKVWRKVREHALRGWILCSDGRLYHPVVAEKALEAWLGRLMQRCASGAGNVSRWGTKFDEEAVKAQIAVATEMLRLLDPNSPAIIKTARRQSRKESRKDASGNAGGNANGIPVRSQVDSRQGTVDRGQGTGDSKEQEQDQEQIGATGVAPPSPTGEKPPAATPVEDKLAARVAEITRDAVEAYNAIMAKPFGLRKVRLAVSAPVRQAEVRKVLDLAKRIVLAEGGSRITPDFWRTYFAACAEDPFLNGTGPYGAGHEGWRPDFTYLVAKKTMAKVYEQSVDDDDEDAPGAPRAAA